MFLESDGGGSGGGGGGLDTALIARQLQLIEERGRRAVQKSRAMVVIACILGELALVLSVGAAVWSKNYEVSARASRLHDDDAIRPFLNCRSACILHSSIMHRWPATPP
jgi:hypothetical protein